MKDPFEHAYNKYCQFVYDQKEKILLPRLCAWFASVMMFHPKDMLTSAGNFPDLCEFLDEKFHDQEGAEERFQENYCDRFRDVLINYIEDYLTEFRKDVFNFFSDMQLQQIKIQLQNFYNAESSIEWSQEEFLYEFLEETNAFYYETMLTEKLVLWFQKFDSTYLFEMGRFSALREKSESHKRLLQRERLRGIDLAMGKEIFLQLKSHMQLHFNLFILGKIQKNTDYWIEIKKFIDELSFEDQRRLMSIGKFSNSICAHYNRI